VSLAPLAADLLAPFPSFGRITDVFRELEEDLNSMIAPVVNNPAVSNIMNVNVDIKEADDAYKIHADVPGLDKKDIQIRVSPDHVLTISGERKYEHQEGDQGDFRRVERAYGTFVRRFALPEDAATEGIEANIKNGELSIHIPKKIPEEGPGHRDIEIKDHGSAGSGGEGDRASSGLDVGAAASAATGAANP
jgi:HSP20 family protein